MLKAKSRWQLAVYDEQRSEEIARECGIPLLLARLLVIRGIDTPQRAASFLTIGEEQFHDPFLLDGMEQAVARIKRAIEQQEAICIYGDYDADGVSSTTLMIHLFRELGATFDYYIPNRFTEGYGLNPEALKQIHERGFTLVVTVDTGISAVEQVAYGQELGLDIIVTDHHEPPESIPEALAVINPKKPGCSYPFDMLAGVGVAFKLAHALLGRPPLHLTDVASIGTIADLVPLVDENRLLASYGLRQLNQTRNIGLKALIRVCGLADRELTAGHVGFSIGPRINAGGRLDTADVAVKLLTATDPTEAEQLAQTLDEMNRERQELVQAIAEEAEAMVREQYPPEENGVLVLAAPGWNVGVIGIVASRMVETFYRPTIILSIDPDTGKAKGSARSIAGFDMYEALTACKELLVHYGGHTMAAGMTLDVDNIGALRERLNRLAAAWLSAEDFIPQKMVDLEVTLDQLDLEVITQLEQLAPFGMGNPTPLVMLRDMSVSEVRKIGRDENHLKCLLISGDQQLDAVGFQLAHAAEQIAPTASLQVLGELAVNEWNGRRKPQLMIRDLAVPHRQVFDWRGTADKRQKWVQLIDGSDVATVAFEWSSCEELLAYWRSDREDSSVQPILLMPERDGLDLDLSSYRTLILYDLPRRRADLQQLFARADRIERIYCLFGDSDSSFDQLHFPSRQQFKQLYQIFYQYRQVAKEHLDALARKQQVKRATLDRMLAIFVELQFILDQGQHYLLHPEPVKASLETSQLYRDWQEQTELFSDLILSSYESLTKLLNQWVAPAAVQEATTV
ncbi:single-stranded-DNA-specific exonuclease RecJ [Brevibacillus humidisoli]|uniref:single-stranded-DNA-specific exonuclease RecJ n=1 Tax=Brevibacillus humidisoli TaxID=2895522 RepID=UPI001E29016E|nr:single-stranded-DNA-specific exonuclease RecJ [Brevibacillus humidisoli]UFJ39007.1 single-stranded-DNA-specific exonuclease RecJ [Brevibacillus humidisoli]